MSTIDPKAHETSFVPATGWRILLPWYDILVALCTREEQVKKHLVAGCRLQSGECLLDVGCGSGTFLRALRDRCEEDALHSVQMHGIDADSHMVDWSRRKLTVDSHLKSGLNQSSEVVIQQARCQHLPYSDSTFSVVSSSLLLHHLKTHEKRIALEEMRRVLQDQGRLLIADFASPKNAVSGILFQVVRFADGREQTEANFDGSLPQLILQAGFTDPVETLCLSTLLGTIRCYSATAVPASCSMPAVS